MLCVVCCVFMGKVMVFVIEIGIGLLCLCWQGFEFELVGELQFCVGEVCFVGYVCIQCNDGYVFFMCDEVVVLVLCLCWCELIFVCQKLVVLVELLQLDLVDCIMLMLEVLVDVLCFGDLWVEYFDFDVGKLLFGLVCVFGNVLCLVLCKVGKFSDKLNICLLCLYVVFVDGIYVFICVVDLVDSVLWVLGILCLKLLFEVFLCLVLKLDEVLLILLMLEECEMLVKFGMCVVDLGVVFGGWIWVLICQYMYVLSIDNGLLCQYVLDIGLVEYLCVDGFYWYLEQLLDWMVCDMVEQLCCVVECMVIWFCEGWCRYVIFNLKLLMKKCWDEIWLCLDLFQDQVGKVLVVCVKQLYYDWEEIMVLVLLLC